MTADRQIKVLMSFPSPGPRSNPFTWLLFDALRSCVDVEYFSWKAAILGRYDVLHLHWPEITLRSGSPRKRPLRRFAFLLMLLRVRLGRPVLVRTLHNVRPHEKGARSERFLLTLCDRWTTRYIKLTDETPSPTAAPAATIPHGHYRDAYPRADAPVTPVPRRMLYFGLVRAYKGIEELIDLVSAAPDLDVELRIAGWVVDAELGERVAAKSAADDRVTSLLRYLSAEELAAEIRQASLIAMPYIAMHNSGSALLALTLERPILVPANRITTALGAEVGPGWVHTFEPPLTVAALESALAAAAAPADAGPRLDRRDWHVIAQAHAAEYRKALEAFAPPAQ